MGENGLLLSRFNLISLADLSIGTPVDLLEFFSLNVFPLFNKWCEVVLVFPIQLLLVINYSCLKLFHPFSHLVYSFLSGFVFNFVRIIIVLSLLSRKFFIMIPFIHFLNRKTWQQHLVSK